MSKTLPYEGLRVVEFTHMVMGPTCGLVLADLGAEVIKVEPPARAITRGACWALVRVFTRSLTATKKAWCSICKRPKVTRPHCA